MTLQKQLKLEKEMMCLGTQKYINSVDEKNDFCSVHTQSIVSKLVIPFSDILLKVITKLKNEYIRANIPVLLKIYNNEMKNTGLLSTEYISLICIRTIFQEIRYKPIKMTRLSANIGRLINENIKNKLSETDTFRIGVYILEMFCSVFNNLIYYDLNFFNSKSKYKEYIVHSTKEYQEYIQDKIIEISEFTNVMYPMIYKPCDWTPLGFDGGFYSDELKTNIVKHKLINEKTGINEIISNAVNIVQSVKWKVRTDMLDYITELNKTEPSTLKKCYSPIIPESPKKPYNIKFNDMTKEQQENHKLWSHKFKLDIKAREAKKSLDLTRCYAVLQAKKFKDNNLYFPHDIDYRNRFYNKSMTGLNTQGSDFQKSLISFGDSREVSTNSGVKWLNINLANLAGHDKLKLDERYSWTVSNEDLIREIVKDPIKCTAWHSWDKPMQGLAAAIEYVKFLNGEPINTHVQLDGKCNGIQHLSAITHDEEVGKHVGLIRTELCPDVYQYVCDKLIKYISGSCEIANEWLSSGLLDRSLTKKPVMTRSYSAKLYGIKDGIKDYINEKNKINHFSNFFEAGNWMGEQIWNSMNSCLNKPISFMNWVLTCSGILAKANKPMIWLNPVGMLCKQSPFVTKTKRIELKINGQRFQYQLRTPTSKINKSKMESSSSPNIIHSCDASHLCNTINRCDNIGIDEITVVHDSYGFIPDDTEQGLNQIKLSWIDMYDKNNWMMKWYEMWSNQLGTNDLPRPDEFVKMGKLNNKDVMRSDFFFC